MIRRAALRLVAPGGTRARLSILIFHRVLAHPDPLLPGEPCVAAFEALMRHVVATYRVLPLRAAVRALRDGTLPPRAVAVTFDDGYADNLALAAPILQRLGIPATVFVATGYLDGGTMWNDRVIEALRATRQSALELEAAGIGRIALDTAAARRAAIDRVLGALKYLPPAVREAHADDLLRRAGVAPPAHLMLTREAVPQLLQAGLDVGAHTVTHPILTAVDRACAKAEIESSKRDLEALTGREIALFAYPNGKPGQDYGPEHVDLVRRAGFAAAVTTGWGTADRTSDPWQLPRFTPWTRQPLKFDLLMMRNAMQRQAQRAA
jgi:peptidoglycan/xylan/chitin deacetylase (PgdA/CDA1 family)